MNLYRKAQRKLKSNPVIGKLMSDIRYRTTVFALISLFINIAFAAYNCFLGMTLKDLQEREQKKKECLLMKRVGITLLFLPIALSGTVILTIKQHRMKSYDTIVMLTITTYTFYKITVAVIGLIKVRKQHSTLLLSIRNINIANAAMSVLPMQSSMIASFDRNEGMDFHLSTIFTGSGICLIFLWLGITMIINSQRKNKWQNQNL